MLDIITKGYIATKLKIEDLLKNENGVIAIEYVALAAGIIVVVGTLVRADGGFGKALVSMFDRLAALVNGIAAARTP